MKNTQIYLQLSPATLARSGFRAPVIPLDTDIKLNRITRHGQTQGGLRDGRAGAWEALASLLEGRHGVVRRDAELAVPGAGSA